MTVKIYQFETREALFCGILGIFSVLSIFLTGSIGIFGFGLACLSVWLFVKPFGKEWKIFCDILILLVSSVTIWISFLRLTKKIGYNDYTPNILVFPVAGVLVLASFYILLCSKDDTKDKVSPVSIPLYSRSKRIFVLSVLAALAMLFTYVWQYYFEPACALLMTLCAVVETVSHFSNKEKIDIEPRKEITLTFFERQLNSLINVSETCFVFKSDPETTPYYLYAGKEKNDSVFYRLVSDKNHIDKTFFTVDEVINEPLFEGKSLRKNWDEVFLYTIENVNTDYWLRTYRHD